MDYVNSISSVLDSISLTFHEQVRTRGIHAAGLLEFSNLQLATWMSCFVEKA